MPKITSVEPQKNNPRRFNVYLDGQFAFGADEDLVVDFRLVPEKELTTSDVEQLLSEAEVGKLVERIYGLFSVRNRSEKEIRDYLKRLSFKRKIKDENEISDLVIESLIEKIKKKGLINDKQFAKDWIEARRRSKKKGKIALKQELFQKGIDREIIEEVMSVGSVEDEEKLALQALEKKLRSLEKLSPLEFRKKVYEYLLRRGFEYEVVKSVIENFIKRV